MRTTTKSPFRAGLFTAVLLTAVHLSALTLTACAGGGGDQDRDRTITVAAATSLTGAFTEIADDFSAANPSVEVNLTFGSSSTLATQIIEGAPADVYASADEANMARLTGDDLIAGTPAIFARNRLVIVTKPGNPEGVETLADLAGVGVISLCGPQVPCGAYAAEALASAGVTIEESSVTRGQNVGATLTAVSQGDAVAGIVYLTDAVAATDAVDVVALPEDLNPIALYPIGVLMASGDTEAAEAFLAHVRGDEGQAVLADHGFLPVS